MIRLTMYKYILILMLVACSADFDEKYEIDENYILTSNTVYNGKFGGYNYTYNLCKKKDFYPPNTRQCLNITADQYNKLKEKQIGIRINE